MQGKIVKEGGGPQSLDGSSVLDPRRPFLERMGRGGAGRAASDASTGAIWLLLFLAAQQRAWRHFLQQAAEGSERAPAAAAHTSGERLGIWCDLAQCLLTGQWFEALHTAQQSLAPREKSPGPERYAKPFVHNAWDTTPIRVCRTTKRCSFFLGWLGIDKKRVLEQ